jgi:hypothetical protein
MDDLAQLGQLLGLRDLVDETAGERRSAGSRVADCDLRFSPATATLSRVSDSPRGVVTSPSRLIASCIPKAAAVAREPSSPSSQQVIAAPVK